MKFRVTWPASYQFMEAVVGMTFGCMRNIKKERELWVLILENYYRKIRKAD